MIIIFALAGPVGIGIGWIISNSYELISAIFLAISAGDLLF